MNARLKMWTRICAHCGLCADTCHFYLAKNKDPKMVPSYKAQKLKELVKKKAGWMRNIFSRCTISLSVTVLFVVVAPCSALSVSIWPLWFPQYGVS